MRSEVVAPLLIAVLFVGCDEPIRCGSFEWDPSRGRCVCPSGTVERSDGTCTTSDDADASADAGREDAAVDAGADACAALAYRDGDADGFGDDSTATPLCTAPTGYVTRSGDCDDARADVSPDGTESCDGIDEDCDGTPDGDDLCTFGHACIDATCTPIPIYEWSAHFRPRAGGSVTAVSADCPPGSDTLVALVAYTHAVDIGATALGPVSQPTLELVRFSTGGAIAGTTRFAEGSVLPRALAVDALGNTYVVAVLTGSARVLGRDLAVAGGRSLLVLVRADGTGWVQRYGELTLDDVAARADGFAACGHHSAPVTIAGETFAGDATGDALIIRGDPTGAVTQAVAVRGAASLECTGIAHRDGRTVVSGGYLAGTVTVGRFNPSLPRATCGRSGSSRTERWTGHSPEAARRRTSRGGSPCPTRERSRSRARPTGRRLARRDRSTGALSPWCGEHPMGR